MLNKILNKFLLIILLFILIFSVSKVNAADFNNTKEFIEYIYANYAEQKFSEVYSLFAPELKSILDREEYLNFQQQNFNKYDLEIKNVMVDDIKELSYKEFKKEFPFLKYEGSFYSARVNYLLIFEKLGEREEEIEKRVYLREYSSSNYEKSDKRYYSLFWDPEPILDKDNESRKDDEQ